MKNILLLIKKSIIPLSTTLILITMLLIFWVVFSPNGELTISRLLGINDKVEILKLLGISLGGFLLIIQANILNNRVEVTEKGLKQERLKTAIEHLGSEKDSIRIGGLYELYHLAKSEKEFRETVCDIICAHIRDTTSKELYQTRYKLKCSNEIKFATDILFKDQSFNSNIKDLSHSYLVGLSIAKEKKISNIIFKNSDIQDFLFNTDILELVDFRYANITNTKFYVKIMTKCNFHQNTGFEQVDFSTITINHGTFDEKYEKIIQKAKKTNEILYIDL